MGTAKIWICDDEPSVRYPVYTRGNVGEVFVEAVSPMSWSTFGPLSWDAGWRDAFYAMGMFGPEDFRPEGECEIVGCFGGYAYINMSVTRVMAVRTPGMTVEAIDRSLFGDYPDVPPYRADPRDVNAARTAQAGSWLQTLFTSDPKPMTDADGRHLAGLSEPERCLAGGSPAELLANFRSLTFEARRQFRRHVLNSYGANVLVSLIAQICQAVNAPELSARLTAAVGQVDSADQSFELWELSRQVAASRTLGRHFDQGIDGLLSRLGRSADSSAEAFLAQWNHFIDRWGFFGPSVWELRSPTYRSQPEIALRMLDRLRRLGELRQRRREVAIGVAEREAAIADVGARLAGNAQLQGQFTAAARAAGNYLAARERSKMQCARVLDTARSLMRDLGGRLVADGILPHWDQALLVNNDEADAFVAQPKSFTRLIAERAARLKLLIDKEPPFVFEGQPPPLSAFADRHGDRSEVAQRGSRLNGIGVSPGLYTGRARVIHSLDEESELAPGEVIVAKTTDASWGPLFLAAGAVVVETGAIVSHAAIVSRELGIPAAVSVPQATRRIRSGATITVDGNTGTVTVQ